MSSDQWFSPTYICLNCGTPLFKEGELVKLICPVCKKDFSIEEFLTLLGEDSDDPPEDVEEDDA